VTTSLALVPSPAETALTQLQVLRTRLDTETIDFAAALDVSTQAETVRAYIRSARLGLQLSNDAVELRLRSERKAGLLLLDMLVGQSLPKQTLGTLGISAKDSSRYQLLARLEQREFDQRIVAMRASGRQLSALPLYRAATQFKRKPGGGRKATPVAALLRKALDILREVRVISTPREVELARAIVSLGEAWAVVLAPDPRPTEVRREVTCMLCGRARGSSRAPRCTACGGNWYQ